MIRTCRTIFTLCLSLFFCSPAMAQHSGPYVGAFLGGDLLMNAKASDNLGDFILTFKPALQGSAVLGWDLEPGNPLGEGRVELEYTRRGNLLDKIKFVEGSFKGGGTVTSDSLLLNCFAVFHDKNRFSPYAGAGLGAARIETSGLQVSGQPISSDSAVVLAYQFGGGVDVALTDQLTMDIGYRFFSSTRPTFTEVNGLKFKLQYSSHSAVIGLRWGF